MPAINWTIYLDHPTSLKKQKNAELQDAHEATQVTLHSIRNLRGQLIDVQQSRQPALVANQHEVLALLGLLSAAVEQSDQGMAVERFSYQSPAALTGEATPAGESLRVELRGVAADPVKVATLVTTIQSWNLFSHVELQSSGPVQIGQNAAHRFSIECTQE